VYWSALCYYNKISQLTYEKKRFILTYDSGGFNSIFCSPFLWFSGRDSTSWWEHVVEQTVYTMGQETKRAIQRLSFHKYPSRAHPQMTWGFPIGPTSVKSPPLPNSATLGTSALIRGTFRDIHSDHSTGYKKQPWVCDEWKVNHQSVSTT
jgi:hypothetical protein